MDSDSDSDDTNGESKTKRIKMEHRYVHLPEIDISSSAIKQPL